MAEATDSGPDEVGLRQHAWPLLEMMKSAHSSDEAITWVFDFPQGLPTLTVEDAPENPVLDAWSRVVSVKVRASPLAAKSAALESAPP